MKNNILLLTFISSFIFSQNSEEGPIKKEFVEPGKVDALAPFSNDKTLYLIQLIYLMIVYIP